MALSLARSVPRVLCKNVSSSIISNKYEICNLTQRLALLSVPSSGNFSTSARRNGLMEFFDNKDNWRDSTVTVGRPWRIDELRLKSNSDLHKLWYILLKERNMVMTMEAEYERNKELMPSPERLEKVEESMENLLDVVQERNRAYNLLETGETGEPGHRWAYNQLGIGFWKKCTEHFKPIHLSTKSSFHGQWQNRFLRLLREKRMLERGKDKNRVRGKTNFIKKYHPHLRGTLKPDFSEFDKNFLDSIKGPKDI